MSQTTTTHKDRISANATAAPAELTIANQLNLMRASSEHRPGEQCFIGKDGRHRWISEGTVNRFTCECGELRPSEYLAEYGIDWKLTFFHGL